MALRIKTRVELDGSDFKKTAEDLKKEVGSFERKLRDVGSALSFKNIAMTTAKLTGLSMGIGAVAQVGQAAVRTNIDFEKSLSVLAGVAGTTVAGIKDLEEEAKRLGAATAASASQVVSLETELAKLGFTKQEILDSTEAVLKFALATGSDLGEAAALSGAALRAFGDDAGNMGRYVSAMAVATTKSALSFEYLQTSLAIVAPTARTFGFSIEDTLALLGSLANAGFDASSAATATRNILLNLADANGKLAKALGKPVKTLPDLIEGLRTLNARGIDLSDTLELTDKRSVGAFNTFLSGAEKIATLRKEITGVQGEFEAMSVTMNDNVMGAIDEFSSAWEALVLKLQGGKGVVKDAINALTAGLRWMQGTDETADFASEAAKKARERVNASGIVEAQTGELQSEVSRKVSGGQSEAAVVKETVTPTRDHYQRSVERLTTQLDEQKKASSEIQAKLQEIDNYSGNVEAVMGKPMSRRDAIIQLKSDWERVKGEITKTTDALVEHKSILGGINMAFPEAVQTPTSGGGKELEEKDIKAKIEELQAAVHAHPEWSPEVVIKYINDIEGLKAQLKEGKEKAYQENIAIGQASSWASTQKFPNEGGLAQTEAQKEQAKQQRDAAKVLAEIRRNIADTRLKIENETDGKELSRHKTFLDAYIKQETEAQKRLASFAPTNDYLKSLPAQTEEKEELGTSSDTLLTGVNNIANLQKQIEDKRTELQVTGSAERRRVLQEEIADAEKQLGKMQSRPATGMEVFGSVSSSLSGINGVVDAMTRLEEVIDSDASAWEKFMAGFGVMQSIVSMVESFASAMEVIETLTVAVTAAKETEAAVDTATTATEIANTVALSTAEVTAETTGATAAVAAAGVETAAKQTETTANVAAAASGAAASQASIPIVGPILAIAAIAAIMAALSGLIKFEKGGIQGIVGGNSPTGDRLLARINSGEMVLNKKQQGNLYAMVTGKSGGNLSPSQQRKLFGEINQLSGKSGLPLFSNGGIMGVTAMPNISVYQPRMQPLYAPSQMNGVHEIRTEETVMTAPTEVQVSGEFKVKGSDLVVALKNVERKRSNA